MKKAIGTAVQMQEPVALTIWLNLSYPSTKKGSTVSSAPMHRQSIRIPGTVRLFSIFFIGRNLDYAVATEGSLKLKEISYIHSEAYAAGELKHGPIALIENGTVVIGIMTDEKLVPKTVSNLQEVVSRGAKTLIVSNQEIDKDMFDIIVNIPKISEYISPVLSVVPLQLLAYYISKEKGLDVDKPRNLAKSVTVE